MRMTDKGLLIGFTKHDIKKDVEPTVAKTPVVEIEPAIEKKVEPAKRGRKPKH
jgi:hypothetical protein